MAHDSENSEYLAELELDGSFIQRLTGGNRQPEAWAQQMSKSGCVMAQARPYNSGWRRVMAQARPYNSGWRRVMTQGSPMQLGLPRPAMARARSHNSAGAGSVCARALAVREMAATG
jgi:hypothetical protein